MVILHEEAEDGNAMPDLGRPVQAVSMAVTNLVKVSLRMKQKSEEKNTSFIIETNNSDTRHKVSLRNGLKLIVFII